MAIEKFLGTPPQRVFIGTIVAQAVIVLAMVAIVYGKVDANVNIRETAYRTIPCYLALFALAEVFEVLIALDALRLRNTIQLIGIILFHCGMIVFSGLQIQQTHTALVTNPGASCVTFYATCSGSDGLFQFVVKFLIVVPAVLAVSLVAMIWETRALFAEFGWAIFHAIGADPRLKSMYQFYQIMICLLKFDFFCFTGVTMQLLILVLSNDREEFALTITAIPVVLFLLVLCGISLKREIKWLMLISLLLMVASETYFIYKLIRIFEPDSRAQYDSTRGSLTTFIVVAALLLLLTFAVGVRCFADFDRGLKEPKLHSAPERPKTTATEMGEQGKTLQRRVSID